jgi:hypothetical protein
MRKKWLWNSCPYPSEWRKTMELGNINFDQCENGIEVNVTGTISHKNDSNLTATMAEIRESCELLDGTVLFGAYHCYHGVCVEPGESYSHGVGVQFHQGILKEQKLKVSASMTFYHDVLEKEVNLSINEDPASYCGSCENFEFEMKKHTFNVRAWVVPDNKSFKVEIHGCLLGEQNLSRDLVVLGFELFDSSGKDRGNGATVCIADSDVKGLSWRLAVWDVKKKDLKGMRLRVWLKFFSAIPGSESSLTQEVVQ